MPRFALLLLAGLTACGGTITLDDSTGPGETDDIPDEPSVSPWMGEYAGVIDFDAFFGNGDAIDFCDGEVLVDVDPEGMMSGTDGTCGSAFGAYAVSFAGRIDDAGETTGVLSFVVQGRLPEVGEVEVTGTAEGEVPTATGDVSVQLGPQPVDAEVVFALQP